MGGALEAAVITAGVAFLDRSDAIPSHFALRFRKR
jgi:hypothetical protein